MTFSTLKINGNCDVNYIWSKSGDLTENDVELINNKGLHTPAWDSSTVMLANFTNSLNASEISQSIIGYVIHRQNLNDNTRYKVAEVPSDKIRIKDFNVENKNSYIYYITPIYMKKGNEVLGTPITTAPVDVDFDYWCIMSLDYTEKENRYTVSPEDIWIFYVNVDGGTFTLVNDRSVMDGLGKYPKVYSGKLNYLKGNLTCYIGDVDNYLDYQHDDIAKIQKWNEFCGNGKLKLLKDIKGHVIPCEITDTTYENNDVFKELPTTISFSFVQLNNNNDISAYISSQ